MPLFTQIPKVNNVLAFSTSVLFDNINTCFPDMVCNLAENETANLNADDVYI